MNETLKRFIVATSADISAADNCSSSCVHLIYRINESGMLQRAQAYTPPRKNIMGIYDDGGLAKCDIERLIRDIITEFMRRNYVGILFDVSSSPEIITSMQKICSVLSQKKILHFIPINLASISIDAKLIVPSSISGGSIYEMLNSLKEKYTASRLCIEIIRTRNDYTMPSYNPEGVFLSSEEYKNIIEKYSPHCFFSQELACKYFTYHTSENTHFVLYDDSETVIYKIKMAEKLGLFSAFLLYSEWGEHSKTIINAK